MKPHAALDDHLKDLALEFVLREAAVPADDEYRLHLDACSACLAEVEDLRRDVNALAFLAEARAPKPDLLSRVTLAQPWKSWNAMPLPSATTFVGSAAEAGWEETAFAGVSAKPLFVDHDHDRVTMLVRMAPGSSYPAHAHGGPEECYVLKGDLQVGSLRMNAGDFQRAERGSEHPVQRTEGGCLLLISSSLHDQLHDHG